MRAYSIFDDYPQEAVQILQEAGIEVTLHPSGVPRPDDVQMTDIMKHYECVIIGTSQKIKEPMFEGIDTLRIIATASVGTDHISVPAQKKDLVKVINTPGANTDSVAEYVLGAMLLARKRLFEGYRLYQNGLSNKNLIRKPQEIAGCTVGIIGAGRISTRVMELLYPFGVTFLCFTQSPEAHHDLEKRFGVRFVKIDDIALYSDIISVNVPATESTYNLVNESIIKKMKADCIFISICREKVVDMKALFDKAEEYKNFYVILDIDNNEEYQRKCNNTNIIITPHMAGGSIEARKRMFMEVAKKIVE